MEKVIDDQKKMGKQQKPADIEEFDTNGWAEIHRSASLGYFKTTERLINEKPSRLELQTLDNQQVTPLWLAFRGGHFDTIDTLLRLGADVKIADKKRGMGVIDIALHKTHYKLIIKLLDHTSLKHHVIEALLKHLSPDGLTDTSAMKSLNNTCYVLDTIAADNENIVLFLEKGLLEKLCEIIECEFILNNGHIETLVVRILYHTLTKQNIQLATNEKLIDLFTQRFLHDNEEAHCIILDFYDERTLSEETFPLLILQKNRIKIMYEFFKKSLTNKTIPSKFLRIAINCLQMRVDEFQHYFSEHTDILSDVVSLMSRKKSVLECIEFTKHYVTNNQTNQEKTVENKLFEVLRNILQTSQEKSVICLASALISSACFENNHVQQHLLTLDYIPQLTSLLRKYKEDRMHEAVIDAIWAVAGGDHKRSIIVIKRVSIPTISEMATSNSSSKLQYYGSQMLQTAALVSYEEIKNHETLLAHLLNALKIATSNVDMVISIMKAIDCLCLKKGMKPNAKTQKLVIEKQAVQVLTKTIEKAMNDHVVAQTWRTVAITTMKKAKYWDLFKKTMNFFTNDLLGKLESSEASYLNFTMETVAIFVLGDNNDVIKMLGKTKQIHINKMQELLDNESDDIKLSAAFHMVVLKDFIHGQDASKTALQGINTLLHYLTEGDEEHIKCRTAEYVCTVAGYETGVKEALVAAGTIEKLCHVLKTNTDIATLIATSAALITVSSSLNGEIELLKICRSDENILALLRRYGNEEHFTNRFRKKWAHFKSLKNPKLHQQRQVEFEFEE